jgi:hypothetical protein
VSHHNNAEIISLLETYFLGEVAVAPITTSKSAPEFHRKLHRDWRAFVEAITLLVSTVELDYDSSDVNNLGAGAAAESVVTSNVRFVSQRCELHVRLMYSMLATIFGTDLRRLFARTAACLMRSNRTTKDFAIPTPRRVAEVLCTSWGQAALHSCRLFRLLLRRPQYRTPTPERRALIEWYIARCREVDTAFLRTVKLHFCDALAELEVAPDRIRFDRVLAHHAHAWSAFDTYLQESKAALRSFYFSQLCGNVFATAGGARAMAVERWRRVALAVADGSFRHLHPNETVERGLLGVHRRQTRTEGVDGGGSAGSLKVSTRARAAGIKLLSSVDDAAQFLLGESESESAAHVKPRRKSRLLSGVATDYSSLGLLASAFNRSADDTAAATTFDDTGYSALFEDADGGVEMAVHDHLVRIFGVVADACAPGKDRHLTLYTTSHCGFAAAAIALVRTLREAMNVELIDLTGQSDARMALQRRTGHRTLPQW